MHSSHFIRILSFSSCLVLFLAACSLGNEIESRQTTVSQTPIAQITVSPTGTSSPPAAPTKRPSLTPTITLTPAPTPTPTATAVPIQISGDPRATLLAEPVPQASSAAVSINTTPAKIGGPAIGAAALVSPSTALGMGWLHTPNRKAGIGIKAW